MDAVNPSWIQLGAVGVLATLVLLELRQIRPVMAGVREVLTALLERERIRSERKREPSDPPPRLPATRMQDFDKEESTDLRDIIEIQRQQGRRASTPVRGIRPPRPGTHHDED